MSGFDASAPALSTGGLSRPRLTALVAGAGVAAAFLLCVALPLATYLGALALFGFAHVVSEMRYVDHRFGGRLRGGLAARLAVPLLVAVLARWATQVGWLGPTVGVALELAAGALLLAVLLPALKRRRGVAVVTAAALLAGAALAPAHTLLFLAVAHNLTPVAFLAQALEGERRRRAVRLSLLLFVGLPLLIATGLPFQALAAANLVEPELAVFGGGDLSRNMAAYVPAAFIDTEWALHAFSAAVFAQCMHYAAVILVLPRLIDVEAPTVLRWPRARTFAVGLALVAAGLASGYAWDYALARKAYALAALVHSWIEIPILVLALEGAAQSERAA